MSRACLHACPRLARARQPLPKPPTVYMPAMPPIGLIARLRRRLDNWQCRARLRRELAATHRDLAARDAAQIRTAIARTLGDNPCRWLADAGIRLPCGANDRD